MSNQVSIVYAGTNVGKIYLSDVGKRLGLGGGREGGYGYGQDQYVMWGETLILQATSEVLMSYYNGVLAYFSSNPASGVWINGAPLTITFGTYADTSDVPLRSVSGSTGIYSDTVLAIIADGRIGLTGLGGNTAYTPAAGLTGYFYGNTNTPGITGASA